MKEQINKEIGSHIANGRIKEALQLASKNVDELSDYPDKLSTTLTLLAARYNNLQRDKRNGVISNDNANMENNKIDYYEAIDAISDLF